jgi:predicted AlkP superfamily pyrophosphatase or phosphodiesterase
MLLTLATLSLALFAGEAQRPAAKRARLVVVLCVDQMRADFVERFAPVFEKGGFGTLLDRGTLFTRCTLGHAFTETGPGHACLLTGRHPGRAGIVENDWYDRASRKSVYCVGDEDAQGIPQGDGRSPRNLLADALGDWMKKANPRAKVVSLAGKDRSAILMGGQKPDRVVWFSGSGLATSTAYGSALPAFAKAWNDSKPLAPLAGKAWEATLPQVLLRSMRVGVDDQPGEGSFPGRTFPHALPAAESDLPRALIYTPFADGLLLDLARRAIEAEDLGKDEVADLLAIGLSFADYVGHAFGPGSVEVAEHFARLNEDLGSFLSFLDEKVGRERVLVALSSDHGVLELPERGGGRRVGKEIEAEVEAIEKALEKEVGEGKWIAWHDFRSIYLDFALARERSVDAASLARIVAEKFRALEWVAEAYTLSDLAALGPRDEFVPLYRSSFNRDRSGDVFLRHPENVLVSRFPTGTSHGSPYPYDRAVPLLLAGPGVPAGTNETEIQTIDLAPTLAEALGVPIPDGIDGRSLAENLRPPGRGE